MPHLCSISDLTKEEILDIFAIADELKTLSKQELSQKLPHRIMANLFFEPSTRTRLSFESAAKQLGMHVLTMNEDQSSRAKGESYLDTLLTLRAVGAEAFVIRSKDEKISAQLATQMSALYPNTHVINGGGGILNHPTQGLLDAYTILCESPEFLSNSFEQQKIVIVGDIKHSRVARSSYQCLSKLGAKNIVCVSPAHLLPDAKEFIHCELSSDLDSSLIDANIVMALRIQKERMLESDIPDDQQYHRRYGINTSRLDKANPDVLVMHPGPMNRGVEISSELADSPRSLIQQQVNNGLYIRMALFVYFLQ